MSKKYYLFVSLPIIFLIFIIFSEIGKFKKNITISEIEELIIPQIRIKYGGIQKNASSTDKTVKYLNEHNSKKDSLIRLDDMIKSDYKVKRYMQISGRVYPGSSNFIDKYYRSVIFEVRSSTEKGKINRDFYFIPLDKKNRFTGYIYFKKKGICDVFAYIFYDYLSYTGPIKLSTKYNTTASLSFSADIIENVPENLHYLLPTKNINCGNRLIRDTSKNLTKNCISDIEKARMIYEFIVFNGGSINNTKKKRIKEYKKTYPVYADFTYHNTYIASQILELDEGICNDFAELYAAMMRALGYKIKIVWGYTDETKSSGHMWNILDLVGDEQKWLKIDPTWGNEDRINYKKWAELYPDFDKIFFEDRFYPFNHGSFTYDQKIEY